MIFDRIKEKSHNWLKSIDMSEPMPCIGLTKKEIYILAQELGPMHSSYNGLLSLLWHNQGRHYILGVEVFEFGTRDE